MLHSIFNLIKIFLKFFRFHAKYIWMGQQEGSDIKLTLIAYLTDRRAIAYKMRLLKKDNGQKASFSSLLSFAKCSDPQWGDTYGGKECKPDKLKV